jgi:hypothetical protein
MEEKPKIREIPKVSIIYENKDDLDNLASDDKFINFTLEEALVSIKDALEKGEKEVCLVEVDNFECKVIIKKKDFKKVLEKIIERYARFENYEECKKISEIINKYELFLL